MVYPHRTSSIPLACHAAYPEWRRSSWQRLDPRARTSSAEYWTQWRRDIEILCFVTQLSVSLFFLSRWLRDHVTLTRETRLQRRVRVKRVLREKEPTTRWWRRKEEKWVEERERERERESWEDAVTWAERKSDDTWRRTRDERGDCSGECSRRSVGWKVGWGDKNIT